MNSNLLTGLSHTNNYVFHGTGSVLEEFEPSQAYNIIDGKEFPDGKPAIFATPLLDYAIFMALINKETCPEGFKSGVTGLGTGNLTYRATQETINQLSDTTTGYVYVFNKSDFREKNKSEWVRGIQK